MFAKNRIENYTYHVNTAFYQYCRHIAVDMHRLRCERKRVKYPRSRKGRRTMSVSRNCRRCKLDIESTSSMSRYRQCRRCERQRNIGNVDNV